MNDMLDTLLLRAGHNTKVVMAGCAMLGIAGGVVGVMGLLRKRSLMADALSHATLPGIALAFLIASAIGVQGRSLPVLLGGAAISGIVGVACARLMVRFTRLREDAAIGAVLSVFFGVGVVLLSVLQGMDAGNQGGIKAFIYGQAAAMRAGDAWLMAGIAAVAIVLTAALAKELTLLCFDEGFARATGWPADALDAVMLALLVLVTVAGLQAVGILLVVAMLIVPAAAARFWTDRAGVLLAVSGAIGGVSCYVGAAVSASAPRLPAGAVIVLTCGAVFALSMLAAPRRGVVATAARRSRAALAIAGEHVLELGSRPDAGAGVGAGMVSGRALAELSLRRGWPWAMRWLVVAGLAVRGLVRLRSAGGGIALTQRGIDEGSRVARNRRLWSAYLVRHADIAPSHVDWSVDQVEHVLGPALVRELEASLGGGPNAAAEGVAR